MILATFCAVYRQIRYRNFMKKLLFFSLIVVLGLSQCKKQNNNEPPAPAEPVVIKDSVIVQGLNFPWEITWGADNFIWMTERGGKISRVNPTTGAVSLLHT